VAKKRVKQLETYLNQTEKLP